MERLIKLVLLFLLIPSLCWAVADDYYVTTTGAGDKSGTTWATAFDWAAFETDLEGSAESGDRYFIKEGTFTSTQDITTAQVGAHTDYIEIIGVVSATSAEPPTSSDWANVDNRPLIASSTYAFQLSDFYRVRNIRMTTTHYNGLEVDTEGIVINCKVYNSSGVSNARAFDNDAYRTMLHSCDGESDAGSAFYMGYYGRIINCYAHDGLRGVYCNGHGIVIANSFFDTNTAEGVNINVFDGATIIHNVFYNCVNAIEGTDSTSICAINNIITNNTDGFNVSTATDSFLIENNNFYSNSSDDVSGVVLGSNNLTASDPDYTNAANADFTVGSSSPVLDAGLQPSTNIGTTGDYKINIGVDQDDNVSGGTTSYGFSN